MANKIILKKSSVVGKVPAAGDLEVGEIAVNLADQKLYSKNASGTVIQLGGGSGSGDVVGPISATDNALARFDGTTGKLIQNGTVTQDDSGNLAGVNSIGFDTTPATPPTAVGVMYWDEGNQTPSVNLNADVTLQTGQESVALVYNGTGSTISNGSVVAVAGAQGQRPSVILADADSESYSASTLGIATQSIANGAEGFVTTFGFVRGIDTSAFTAGQAIWLSQTAGQFTATRPAAPAHSVFLGWVIKVNASSGEVFVNISNGWELDELHNVLITSPTSGNTLIYDASAGVWKNANLTDGTGITITEGAGSITIANAGVTNLTGTTNEIDVSASTGSVTLSLPATINADTTGNAATATSAGKWTTARTLSFTGDATGSGSVDGSANVATALTLANTTVTAGSYTNTALTVDSKGRITAASSGTAPVTSVGATAPIQTSGGTTPTISITQASSTTNGYLSSTDWNTFNNKTSNTGTVTSITAGTGLSGGTITGSGTIALANTTVTAGSYTSANITVDAQGRITAASNGSGGSAAWSPYQFVATAGQTTFAVGVTLSVIQVFANGALQIPSTDYNVSGTDVVFTSGVTVNTVVTVIVFSSFNVADTYTQSAANALFLTNTTANATYLTQSNAASTYLTQANAASTYLPLSGGALTGQLLLDAGGTGAGAAPLEYQAGTLQTTAEAGACEYDGFAFYSSVSANTRGVAPSEQWIVLSSNNTLTSQTAAQAIFDGGGGTASGAVTLPVGTYEFECSFALTGMSATSGSFGFAFGGTATETVAYNAQASKSAGTALTTAIATSSTFNTGANTAIAVAGTGTVGTALIKGIIRVAGAGTIIPQVSLGVAAAAVVQAGSYFKVSPIGNSTVTTVGNWS